MKQVIKSTDIKLHFQELSTFYFLWIFLEMHSISFWAFRFFILFIF